MKLIIYHRQKSFESLIKIFVQLDETWPNYKNGKGTQANYNRWR